MLQELKEAYGFIFEDELIEEINSVGKLQFKSQGEKIIEIGDYVKMMPLLIEGAIKIMREDKDGDELLLYFLERGDTCAMTLSCCLGQTRSEIRAIAERDTKLVMSPATPPDTRNMAKHRTHSR